MATVLGSSSPLEPWTSSPHWFAQMYGGPLPAIAAQLFAIPASEAEAERTIKIIRAVIGKHSSQLSNEMLIARVRLSMQCLQARRAQIAARRAALERVEYRPVARPFDRLIAVAIEQLQGRL